VGGGTSLKVLTADWIYLRFHGPEGKYAGRYTEEQLEAWAAKTREKFLDAGLCIYAYFSNDAHGYAVENALCLTHLLVA